MWLEKFLLLPLSEQTLDIKAYSNLHRGLFREGREKESL
jgi:hypothetical protein